MILIYEGGQNDGVILYTAQLLDILVMQSCAGKVEIWRCLLLIIYTTALSLHCQCTVTALHYIILWSALFTAVFCTIHIAAQSTIKHQRAPYWIKEHSSVLHQYWTVQNIQCTSSYCKVNKLSLFYTVCMYLYTDAQCLLVEREASLSLLFRTRAPGQIVMHNKRSLHSNQKVQQFRNILYQKSRGPPGPDFQVEALRAS